MTETPPEQPSLDEQPELDTDDQTGFMVYDLTEKRYVGRKNDSKSAAEKTVEKRKDHKYETRKV